MSWLKRIRGAVGTAIMWATGWAAIGAISGLGLFLFWPTPVGFEIVAWQALGWAWVGFVAGGAFSTVLNLVDGRRTFDQLSVARMAAWGATGGVLLGVSLGISVWARQPTLLIALNMATVTPLSAACAAGSLALARGVDDRERLGAASDVRGVGVTEHEGSKLLGVPGR